MKLSFITQTCFYVGGQVEPQNRAWVIETNEQSNLLVDSTMSISFFLTSVSTELCFQWELSTFR